MINQLNKKNSHIGQGSAEAVLEKVVAIVAQVEDLVAKGEIPDEEGSKILASAREIVERLAVSTANEVGADRTPAENGSAVQEHTKEEN